MRAERKPHPWTLPRAFPRYVLDVRVTVKADQTLHGRTKDIAEGGIGATIPGDINTGQTVEIELHLPEISEPLAVRAEVKYRRGFQYGFQFQNATDQQREMIRRSAHALPLAP
ncbi:MAG TPA: PilZ domain-containing protein [Candidatus Angelobacter sp.]|nr:PilZ domain-containing protein [Candidatus Angelobacter sp.]